eukprot:6201280-Pleurochrysis_carterae.AAC.7
MSWQHIFVCLALSPFANLLPCVRQWYGRAGCAPRLRCPMGGTFLVCLSFHASLLQTQHAYPDVMITAFAYDDYAVGPAARAMAARARMHASALSLCNFESVSIESAPFTLLLRISLPFPTMFLVPLYTGQGQVSRDCDCSWDPHCSPEFVTSHISHSRAQIRSRLSFHTAHTDTHRGQNAAKSQTLLLCQCANTDLNYTLCTVPPSLTEQCALEHDVAINTAVASVLACPHATASDMFAAVHQARLPVSRG